MITKPKGTYDLINEDARIYKYLSSIMSILEHLFLKILHYFIEALGKKLI